MKFHFEVLHCLEKNCMFTKLPVFVNISTEVNSFTYL